VRTVITGFGLLTPVGMGREAAWQGILAGKSAVRTIETFDHSGLDVHLAAELPGFDAKTLVDKKDRKQLRTMGKAIQIGFVAGSLALQDAKLAPGTFEPTRLGISFGASTISSELEELAPAAVKTVLPGNREVDMKIWGTEGMPLMPPLWLLKYLPNFAAAHVSILNNAQGPSNSITMQDVAGNQAIAEAYRIIRRGGADIMLTGGSDSRISILSYSRTQLFYPYSKQSVNPAEACRPFDKDATGVILGEGAGILVLEELSHARKREASIYAEVVGYGDACDFDRDGSGIAQAIEMALKSAAISPQELDHIVAQGYGHPPFDIAEAKAIQKVFGQACPPVVALKGILGNTGAASGGIETAYSALALHHGTVPASINYANSHPDCSIPVQTEEKPVSKPYSLKINFADLGQCTVIVLKRWQGS
ncbi:MAG TPA: beta-ketoacyl-[acyl-carrier-protein] synthase family protein, partial [Gemmatales bacterium]|nr:beta-ketoacyl-[acyl-carrier-protein] synthase family protein [Gemmatales bacterium]